MFLKEKEIQAISTLEKVGKKKAQQNVSYSSINNNKNQYILSTSSTMPSPKQRELNEYSDVISDIDNSLSEMETDHLSSSSQTIPGKQPIILPKMLQKNLETKSNNKPPVNQFEQVKNNTIFKYSLPHYKLIMFTTF